MEMVPADAFLEKEEQMEIGNRSKKRRRSPANKDESDDERDSICAKTALEYYNNKNATHFELASAFFLSNEFESDGTWVHCNFAAKQPSRDMNGKSMRRLFFAEMHGDDSKWTVTCCIVLAILLLAAVFACFDVVHPHHGVFRHGHHKSFHTKEYSPTPYLPTSTSSQISYKPTNPSHMPTPEMLKPYEGRRKDNVQFARPRPMEPSAVRLKHAETALDFYNYKNGTNYEVVDAFLCNDVLSDGNWYHINFTAKQPKGDISLKSFFAEI